jgi:serine/threonine-protein kinase RsbT
VDTDLSRSAVEEITLPIRDEVDIVQARSLAREAARRLGFGIVDQSRVATAVSELTRNVIRYAGSGSVVIHAATRRDGRTGIEIVVADQGPGIADVELALREGYSSGSGLGLGLPGTRRLMDELEIDSVVGQGTTVTIRKWLR